MRQNIVYHSPTGGHNVHINGRFPNALIERNQMYGGVGSCLGLQMGLSRSTIQDNTCHTVVSAAIWLLNYYQNTNPDIRCYDQNYNVFRNNTIVEDGRNWISADANDVSQPAYRVSDECAQGAGTHDMGHNTFEGNIFVHWCASPAVCPSGLGPVLMYDGPSATKWLSTDTWRNNILFNISAPQSIARINGKFVDWDWFTNTANVPQSSGNRNADPKFTAADPSWFQSGARWNLTPSSGAQGRAAAEPAR
jgi:hypothetical protein